MDTTPKKAFRYDLLYLLCFFVVLLIIVVSLSFKSSPVSADITAVTTIASGGTINSLTKTGQQYKIFFDGTRWWAFYMKSGTANTLFYAYSTDLVSWTETSTALGAGTATDGGSITTYFHAASNTVLVTSYDAGLFKYIRGVISGTTITWDTQRVLENNGGASEYTVNLTADSSGRMVAVVAENTNPEVYRSTNSISATFTDANWTDLALPTINDSVTRNMIFSLGSGNLLVLNDDSGGACSTTKCVAWSKYTGSWSVETAVIDNSNASRTDWDAVKLSDTDIRFLGVSAASTFSFQKFNGTSWSTLTAPTFPSGGLKSATSSISMISDGSNVWAFVIRGDANNTVSYNRYSGTTWSGWQDITTTSATRSYVEVSPNMSPSRIAVTWTEVNGGNFDLKVVGITPSLPNSVINRGNLKIRSGATIIFR